MPDNIISTSFENSVLNMSRKIILAFCLYVFFVTAIVAQQDGKIGKGSLFIIGGGSRSQQLMQTLLTNAHLKQSDYIVVLPMATVEPDSAYYYFKISVDKLCSNTIADLNFTRDKTTDKVWLDSLKQAKLIYIPGGDQNRFMNVVLHTPVYDAIHRAYANGATIAGTSAGAAVMSRYMITGKELIGDTSYNATFKKIRDKNLDLQEGLNLVDSAIIDQHFIVRSRYNRLLSALAKFPDYPCVGIDESTAIIVRGNTAMVTGESQVIVLRNPKGLQVTDKGLIKFNDIQLSIYTAGDTFSLR